MNSWADLWNALTGIGTLALAIATFCVIRQGQQQRKDVERQHRDRLKPICCLTPYNNVDPWAGRGELIKSIDPSPEAPSFGRVVVNCMLQNIGTGPALKLKLRFRFLDMNGWMTEPWELSPLGAGAFYGSQTDPLVIPIRLHEKFNITDFQSITGKPWEILLDYEDVFGKKFQTVHCKMLFNPDPATFEWTTPPPGQEPKAIMRPIPWLTYIESGERA